MNLSDNDYQIVQVSFSKFSETQVTLMGMVAEAGLT